MLSVIFEVLLRPEQPRQLLPEDRPAPDERRRPALPVPRRTAGVSERMRSRMYSLQTDVWRDMDRNVEPTF